MNRNWYITEKIISLALIIWGGFLLYLISTFLLFIYNRISWENLSLIKTFTNFHFVFFLPLATVVAGVLLLFEKKIGLIMALITLFLNPFIFIIPKDKHSNTFSSAESVIVAVLISLLCFATFRMLFAKPFRLKYKLTKNNCITVAVFVFILLF